ncbi:unnamed protein product [Notodromas monacha]|uniref:Homeotic protein spalt-major n=1 Tax=Notodromas monacha TaxID=399045 RepID=A0A7R9GCH6_9CRUS|nr:unnamed protein product [Notodromas monacha]CAG0916124.1 unnamed protein product [Notodromas monacha]
MEQEVKIWTSRLVSHLQRPSLQKTIIGSDSRQLGELDSQDTQDLRCKYCGEDFPAMSELIAHEDACEPDDSELNGSLRFRRDGGGGAGAEGIDVDNEETSSHSGDENNVAEARQPEEFSPDNGQESDEKCDDAAESPTSLQVSDAQAQFQQALAKMQTQRVQLMKLLGLTSDDLRKPEVLAQIERLGLTGLANPPDQLAALTAPFGSVPDHAVTKGGLSLPELRDESAPKNWQEFLVMQSTLYTLQQQQMMHVQLIHQIQQQLNISQPGGGVAAKEDESGGGGRGGGGTPSPGVAPLIGHKPYDDHPADALVLLSKLGSGVSPIIPAANESPDNANKTPLKFFGHHLSEEQNHPMTDANAGESLSASAGLPTGRQDIQASGNVLQQQHSPPMSATSLALSVIPPSSEPMPLDQPTSLEMLQRTTQEVLSKASKNLLINSLVDDLAKSPTSGDDKSKEAMMRHRCRYCGKVFGSDSALQIHIRSHTGERPFKCNVCGNRFTTKGNLKVHFQRHQAKYPHIKMNPHPFYHNFLPPTAMVPNSFLQGLTQFQQAAAVAAAAAAEQETPENLTVSHKSSALKRAMSPSQKAASRGGSGGDDGKSSESHAQLLLDAPKRKKHRSGPGDEQDIPEDLSGNSVAGRSPSPCPSSPTSASMMSRPSSPVLPYRLHKQSGHPPASASAPAERTACDDPDPVPNPVVYNTLLPRPGSTDNSWESLIEVTPTSETSKLQQLVDNITQNLNEPNQCVICHRVLSCKSALQMHYRTHTGERPFKCRICGRAFATKGNLKTHMSIHRLKPPSRTLHQCPVCHRKYASPSALEQHIRLHTGEPTDMTTDQIDAEEVRSILSFPLHTVLYCTYLSTMLHSHA